MFEKTSKLIHDADRLSIEFNVQEEYETIDGQYFLNWESFLYSTDFINYATSLDQGYYTYGPAISENFVEILMPHPDRFAVKVIGY